MIDEGPLYAMNSLHWVRRTCLSLCFEIWQVLGNTTLLYCKNLQKWSSITNTDKQYLWIPSTDRVWAHVFQFSEGRNFWGETKKNGKTWTFPGFPNFRAEVKRVQYYFNKHTQRLNPIALLPLFNSLWKSCKVSFLCEEIPAKRRRVWVARRRSNFAC